MLSRQMLLETTWQRCGDHRGCYRRICAMCRTTFFTARPEARYCRPACRQRAYRWRRREDGARYGSGFAPANESI